MPLFTCNHDAGCRLWRLILWALLLATVGCDGTKRPNYQHDVEVAPNQWLTLHEKRGKCWFITEWKGKKVVWDGKRNQDFETELPVTLREYDGNLYLIVANRESFEAPRYVYLKLDGEGTRFVEIAAAEFPKRIATQNMELSPRTRVARTGKSPVDTWELLRRLDYENPQFYMFGPTADVWMQLETGMELRTIRRELELEDRKRLVAEYAEKYKPIPLPTLVKE